MNRLVLEGMSFRDAYIKVGVDIENETYNSTNQSVNHTHEGSIGNLCISEIKVEMDRVIDKFNFKSVDLALEKLTN